MGGGKRPPGGRRLECRLRSAEKRVNFFLEQLRDGWRIPNYESREAVSEGNSNHWKRNENFIKGKGTFTRVSRIRIVTTQIKWGLGLQRGGRLLVSPNWDTSWARAPPQRNLRGGNSCRYVRTTDEEFLARGRKIASR